MAEFEDRLMGVVETMHADGVPEADIMRFIAEEKGKAKKQAGATQNAARAQRMEALEQQQQNISPTDFIGSGLKEAGGSLLETLASMARGGKKLVETVNPVTSRFGEPEVRRELLRGLGDTVTFGMGNKLANAADPQFAAQEATDAEAAPDYRGAGGLAGAFLPGGGSLAARGSMKAMSKLPVRPSVQALAAAPIAGAAVGGAMGAVEGIDEGLRGGGALEALKEAAKRGGAGAFEGATDPLGAAVPLAAVAGSGVSNALRSNKTSGRVARAKESGAYQDPEMKALPKGQEGMQKASEQGLDRIVSRDRQLAQEASRRYHEATSPEMDKAVDTEAMRMRLLEGRQANVDPDSGLPIRPEVDQAYNTAFDKTPEAATVRGTLMRRRGLQQDAAFGAPSPSEKQLAQRDVYQTFREAVRDASPEVAQADDAYTAHARQAGRRSDILFNTEENVIPSGSGSGAPDARPVDADPQTPAGAAAGLSDPALRVGKARSAATTLGRVDDTNAPGLRAARFLEELAGQDPAFAEALDFIANKKAQEGTRFGIGSSLPTSLSTSSFARQLIDQNARALGGRVVEPMANATSKAGPGALRVHPVLRAYAAEQERNRALAAKLKGGPE